MSSTDVLSGTRMSSTDGKHHKEFFLQCSTQKPIRFA